MSHAMDAARLLGRNEKLAFVGLAQLDFALQVTGRSCRRRTCCASTNPQGICLVSRAYGEVTLIALFQCLEHNPALRIDGPGVKMHHFFDQLYVV